MTSCGQTWTPSGGCNGAAPTLQEILVNACGNEGWTEYVLFNTGSGSYDPSTLDMVGSSTYTGAAIPPSGVNAAGNPLSSNFSGANATAIVATLNLWSGNCNAFIAAPNPIPPNSTVMAFPSSNGITSISPVPNLASYCGQTIYVVSGNYNPVTSNDGFFVNTASTQKTVTVNFGGCTWTATYSSSMGTNGANLTNGGGGASQINSGAGDCFPPPPCTLPVTPIVTPATLSLCAGGAAPTFTCLNCTATSQWTNAAGTTVLGTGTTFTPSPAPAVTTTYNVQNIGASVACNSPLVPITLTVTSPPAPPGYGCGSWNVEVYNDGVPAFSFNNFTGYYNTADDAVSVVPTAPTVVGAGSFEFNTANDGFPVQGALSSATGYIGCPAGIDGFTMRAKRTCFPCGYYKIFLKIFDDDFRIKIDQDGDGTVDFLVDNPPFCTANVACNSVIWEGFLNNNSKVDVEAFDWTPNGLDFKVAVAFLVQPIAVTAANDGPHCPNQPTNLTSTLSPASLAPNPPFTYSWTGPSGFAASGQNTVVNPSVAGTYMVSVTAPSGCVITATTVVTTGNLMVTASNDSPKCEGTTVNLSSTPSGASTYAWTGPNGFTSNSQNPVLNNSTSAMAGAYFVTVTNNGCQGTATTIVTLTQPPVIPTLPDLTVCQNASVPVAFPPGTLPAGTTLSWSGPNGFTSNSNTPTIPNINCPAPCQYSVTATQGSCSVVKTFNVSTIVPPGVTPVLNPNVFNICQNGTLSVDVTGVQTPPPFGIVVPIGFINTVITFPAGGYSLVYIWKDPTGTIITTTSTPNLTIPNATQAGVYTVELGWTTVAGGISVCNGVSSTFTVNISAGLTISATKTTICEGETTSISATGGSGYSWSSGQNGSPIVVAPLVTTTYTVLSSSGCTGNIVITVKPTPSVTLNANPNPICAGATTNLNATGGTSYAWSVAGAGTGATTPVSPTTTTTYNVTVTNNGCTATQPVTVVVNPKPIPTISGSTTICPGGSTVLNAGAGYTSYLWSAGGQTTPSITVSTAGTYTVTVTNSNGCTGTASTAISINANLTPTIVGGGTFCQGTPTSLNAGSFDSYVWSVAGQTSQTLNVTNSGTYFVTVTQQGCTGTGSGTVTIQTPPPFNVTPSSATICQGETTSLTATVGFSNYQWTPSGGNTATATVSNQGTYTVTATNNVCTVTANASVTVKPKPVPAITGNLSICPGVSTTLTATPSGAGYTYNWSTSSTQNTTTVNTTGVVTVTVSDANCSATATATVVPSVGINAKATATDKVICFGYSTNLQALGGTNFLWDNGSTTSIINVSPTTTTTYVVTVSDAAGCKDTAQIKITVNPIPSLNLPGTGVFCQGDSLAVQATTLNATGLSYLWSNGKTTGTIYIKTPGTYTVTATYPTGCKSATWITVTQNNKPIVTISGSKTFCSGTSTTLDAGVGFVSYKWSNNATTQTITVNTSGTYSVTVTDANGCKGVASVTVKQSNKLSLTIKGNDFCKGTTATLDAGPFTTYKWSNNATTQTISTNKPGKYCVTVSDGNCQGDTCITINELALPVVKIQGKTPICENEKSTLTLNKTFPTIKWSNNSLDANILVGGGTYTVTVSEANGCSATDQFTVVENPNPKPLITGPLSICQGIIEILDAGAGYTNYLWAVANQPNQVVTTPTLAITESGNYAVTVTDAKGCKGATTFTVAPGGILAATIVGKDESCQGENTTLAAVGGSITNFLWSTNETTASITINQSGTYKVTVTGNGCQGTISKTIVVHPLPIVDITGKPNICNGKPATLSTLTNQGTYEWSTGAAAQNTTGIIADKPGTYWVKVTTTKGCVKTDTVIVTQQSTISNLDTTICENDKFVIQGQTFDKGNLKGKITILNPIGCDSIINVTVKIRPTVRIDLKAAASFCSGQDAEVTVDANGYTGTFDLEYQVNGASNTTLTNIKDGYKIKITPTTSTVYKIIKVTLPPPSCPPLLGFSAAVIVSEIKPLVVMTSDYSGFGVSCFDDKDGKALATVSNATAPFSYEWDNGETNDEAKKLSKGKHYVTITDAKGCKGIDSVFITSPTPLTFTLTPTFPNCKNPKNGALTLDSLQGGSGSYVYSYDGGAKFFPVQGNLQNPQKITSLDGGTYTVVVKDLNDCEANATVTMPKVDGAKLSLGEDQFLELGDSIQLDPKANFNIKNVIWYEKRFLSCTDCKNPISTPFTTIIYTLTASDTLGCVASDEVTIHVNRKRPIYIPTAFSPESSAGINDIFMIYGDLKVVLNIQSFQVFDRWGTMVFSEFNFKPNDPAHGWDGTFRGKYMNDAVFTYAVKVEFIDKEVQIYKGDVTLMRTK